VIDRTHDFTILMIVPIAKQIDPAR
jgi:hypothetical protein